MTPNITPEALERAVQCFRKEFLSMRTDNFTNDIERSMRAALPELLAAQPTPCTDERPCVPCFTDRGECESRKDFIQADLNVLRQLRASIHGDCYMGEEWEIDTIDKILGVKRRD